LGGWLMAKPDRFRWMETAREGVNQRGLDELSNSKRAHFVYEGGPVFSSEKEGEDGDSPTTEVLFCQQYNF
jgi:hypothetical protein